MFVVVTVTVRTPRLVVDARVTDLDEQASGCSDSGRAGTDLTRRRAVVRGMAGCLSAGRCRR